MDALDKLLKKSSYKDKLLILTTLQEIRDPDQRKTLDIKKLVGEDFYRVRKGNFRIIFHLDGERVVIDAVRLRNEKTYKF